MGVPIVVAPNMMDVAKIAGLQIDVAPLLRGESIVYEWMRSYVPSDGAGGVQDDRPSASPANNTSGEAP